MSQIRNDSKTVLQHQHVLFFKDIALYFGWIGKLHCITNCWRALPSNLSTARKWPFIEHEVILLHGNICPQVLLFPHSQQNFEEQYSSLCSIFIRHSDIGLSCISINTILLIQLKIKDVFSDQNFINNFMWSPSSFIKMRFGNHRNIDVRSG